MCVSKTTTSSIPIDTLLIVPVHTVEQTAGTDDIQFLPISACVATFTELAFYIDICGLPLFG